MINFLGEEKFMREITRTMINFFEIRKLGYDFMGYTFKPRNLKELSFHHLIVSKRDCELLGYGDGYTFENGSILVKKTAHDYLHVIEFVDPDIYNYIREEMIKENRQREITIENLRRIRSALVSFEREHSGDKKNGRYIIQPSYVERRIGISL